MPRDVSLSDSKCWNGGQNWVNYSIYLEICKSFYLLHVDIYINIYIYLLHVYTYHSDTYISVKVNRQRFTWRLSLEILRIREAKREGLRLLQQICKYVYLLHVINIYIFITYISIQKMYVSLISMYCINIWILIRFDYSLLVINSHHFNME